MNKQKQTYLSPETETLVVRFEESVLQVYSPGIGSNGSQNSNVTDGGWSGGWENNG